ncbi:hypothetical protein B0H21DRAFT_277999 [Amylocystis lapponica]|nr:hypothetical protein B0H21DRAFT_277999 [Amylocystis lapponica]
MANDTSDGLDMHINSPVSTPSTTSDDNDAVNTESARVYFGPMQSPEKKFAPNLEDVTQTPQLRRSGRLSAAIANPSRLEERSDEEDMYMEQDDAGAGQSRDGTPTADIGIPDEPSSVLASKILRAHDNPSPPPHSPRTEHLNSTDQAAAENDLLVDISDSPARHSRSAQGEPADFDIPNLVRDPLFEVHTEMQHLSTPSPQQSSPGPNISQQDLINFDSFSTPSGSPHVRNLQSISSTGTHSTRNVPGQRAFTTVDDLLLLSPMPSPSVARITSDHDTNVPEITTPSVDEENQVLQVLSQDILSPSSSVPMSDIPVILEPTHETQTPVRRSTRPRRSCSPFTPKIISNVATSGGSPGKTASTSAGSGTLAFQQSPLPPTSLVVKKKSKGKGREASPVPGREGSGRMETDGSNANRSRHVPSAKTDLQVELSSTLLNSNNLHKDSEKSERRTHAVKTHRELGSLSPGSTDVLMQLLPNASGSGGSSTSPVPEADAVPPISALFPTQQPTFPLTSNFTSHPEPGAPLTPSKFSDANRSPPRRIPIAQAIAQGTFSAQRRDPSSTAGSSKLHTGAPGIGLLGSPVFRRPALDDPTRSPAKRVPISQLAMPSPAKGKAPARLASPVRPFPRERERSGSAEPRPLTSQKGRSGSAEPSRPSGLVINAGKDWFSKKPASLGSQPWGRATGSSAMAEKPKSTLPYPIVAGPSRVPTSIPEENDSSPIPSRGSSLPPSSPPMSSPSKPTFSLRQPLARATSRIPRIGAKPYARPKATQSEVSRDTKPPVVARRATGAGPSTAFTGASNSSARPFRMVRHATGSGSSSDEGSLKNAPPGQAVAGATPVAKNPTLASLKRKRDGDKSKASPPGAQPVVIIRKVVPGMFNKTQPSPAPSGPAKETIRDPSPQRVQGRIKMRKVADWKRPQPEQPLSNDAQTQTGGSTSNEASSQPPSDSAMDARVHGTATSSSSAFPADITSPPVTLESGNSHVHPIASTSSLQTQSSEPRRTTRSRRHADPPSDVFGTITTAAVQPLHPRRKRTIPTEPSAFTGMSALALRALTTSNTNKNQHHVVDLRTEIIRKEGARPGSPTTRIRTVLDKQKAAKVQERKERAERRARRSDGAVEDAAIENEASHGVGDDSVLTIDIDGVPTRHRRGPGDEEDYETPDRPPKRGRFEGGMGARDGKRVKWDRGLATTVYFDDPPSTPQRPPRAEVVKKGCLTPAAKTLRLDTLGNVLNADAPLSGVVQENIVVKKFVYDDDDPPSDPPPKAIVAPLAIKPARSKTRKSKS